MADQNFNLMNRSSLDSMGKDGGKFAAGRSQSSTTGVGKFDKHGGGKDRRDYNSD